MMVEATVRNAIRVALLASGEPLSVDDLRKLFARSDTPKRGEVKEALAELVTETEGNGVSLVEVASGWQYQVDGKYAETIGRLWDHKPPRYGPALLETLALIAYRQPITRGEMEQMRGVEPSSKIMQTLIERGWIRIAGHRQTPGRPALYVTTQEFLDYFRLKSLKDLPPLPKAPDPAEIEPPLPLAPPPEMAAAETDDADPDEEAMVESEAGEEAEAPAAESPERGET